MDTKPPSAGVVAAILVFFLSCFGVGLFVWRTFGGTTPLQAKGYRVHVLFGAEGTQLTEGSQVRIAGIPVGRVTATTTRGRRVDATLQLDAKYAPMPADTRAIVRYKTLLGESFISLTPGTPGGPSLPEGATLPLRNVAPKQTIDQVLSTFDRPTRLKLKQFLGDLHTALRGRGQDINDVLGNAATASDDLARLSATLDAEDPALRDLVRYSAKALDTIGRRSTDARRLVRAGERVFTATGARDRELTRAVRAMPGFLTRLRATLAQLDRTGAAAAPVLHTLRPVAPLVKPGLKAARALAPALRTTFTRADPIVKASGKTLPALTATLGDARSLMGQLEPAGRQLVPVLQLLADYRREAVASLANAASATNTIINGHHGLRILLTLNSQAAFGQTVPQGSWRSNPYPGPGGIADLAVGKGAFTCRDANRPTTVPVGSAPPCLVQQPWSFQGDTHQYHRVQPNRP